MSRRHISKRAFIKFLFEKAPTTAYDDRQDLTREKRDDSVADVYRPRVFAGILPALIGIAAASIVTAPLGAKPAHSLPIDKLKKIFALLLIVMGTKMLVSLM